MGGPKSQGNHLSIKSDVDDRNRFNGLAAINVDTAEDVMSLRITAPIIEDVFEELEDFMRLVRMGMFADALEFFAKTLQPHLKIFPVFAEYLECLYDQGQITQVLDQLGQYDKADFKNDEIEFLELLRAYLEALDQMEQALVRARTWLKASLPRGRSLTNTEILSSEVVLGILTYCESRKRPTLFLEDYLAPVPAEQPGIWGGWTTWCLKLWDEEKLWEAQRVFSLVIPLLNEIEVRRLFRALTQSPQHKPAPEEAQDADLGRFVLDDHDGRNHEMRALIHLSLVNSVLDFQQHMELPLKPEDTARLESRVELVKEIATKALRVCDEENIEPNCRQILEYRGTQLWLAARNCKDVKELEKSIEKLQAILRQAEANKDDGVNFRCESLVYKTRKRLTEVENALTYSNAVSAYSLETKPTMPSTSKLFQTSGKNLGTDSPKSSGQNSGSKEWLEAVQKLHFDALLPYYDEIENPLHRRIRIAVLDTGYDPKVKFFQAHDRKERLKAWRDYVGGLEFPEDRDGHGSMIVSLVMKVAPYADLFVARIARDLYDLQASINITEAISLAVDVWKADIITMAFDANEEQAQLSYGFGIPQAFSDRSNPVLFFAGASNEGSYMYPAMLRASHGFGIPIYGTDSKGNFLDKLNLSIRPDGDPIFGTLAEDIPDADGSSVSREYPTDTSFATAIATGLAAMVLEYVQILERKKRHEHAWPLKWKEQLSTRRGMIALFDNIARTTPNGRYYLPPAHFFKKQEGEREANIISVVEELKRSS